MAENLELEGLNGKFIDTFRKCGITLKTLSCRSCYHEHPVPISCDLRVCPECARARSNVVYHRLKGVIVGAAGGGYTLKLITLTLRKRDVLEDLERLGRLVPKLVRFMLRAPGFGCLAGFEVGAGGNVHAHLVYFGPYVAQARLRDRWYELTGDSSIVDVRRWKGSRGGVLREACKYACKAVAVDPRLAARVEFALRGKRRLRTYGLFYGVSPEEEPTLVCEKCGGDEWSVLWWSSKPDPDVCLLTDQQRFANKTRLAS